MSKILSILFIILYLIRTFRNILYHIFLWQLKEYRPDRMWAHLKTRQGKKWIYGSFSLAKWASILIYIIYDIPITEFHKWIVANTIGFLLLMMVYLPVFIYSTEGLKNIFEFFKYGWKVPVFTIKSISTFFLTLILLLLLWNLRFEGPALFLNLLLIDKLIGPLVAIILYVLDIPKILYKKWFIFKAANKLKELKQLKVIGITGSVGKTSTKEFAAQILSEKFNLVKTPESQNVDIGIAKIILNQLNNNTDILVVEMAAYKKGEIREICDIVKPQIGIITNIGQQHIALFGSQENITEAKYELINALPPEGVAIFNGDNKYCLDLAKRSKQKGLKTLIYGMDNKSADIFAKNIKVFPERLEFVVQIGKDSAQIKANLLGRQNIPNLLAAIAVSSRLGIGLESIRKAIEKIKPPDKTMKLIAEIKGTKLIDDTFNASSESLKAALDYMQIYKGNKILILTPLIELGEYAASIHEEFGQKCAEICDLILLTNINYYSDLLKGVKKVGGGQKKIHVINQKVGTRIIRENLAPDSVAIFEGKESVKILENLL